MDEKHEIEEGMAENLNMLKTFFIVGYYKGKINLMKEVKAENSAEALETFFDNYYSGKDLKVPKFPIWKSTNQKIAIHYENTRVPVIGAVLVPKEYNDKMEEAKNDSAFMSELKNEFERTINFYQSKLKEFNSTWKR